MPSLIKAFSDGRHLEFDQGSFDGWCVYLVQPGGQRRPPLDTDYFSTMRDFAARHGAGKVYGDYIKVYERTTGKLDETVLSGVSRLAASYGSDALQFDVTMTTIYAGMIAEERKAYTKLGKRVKRLGIHQVIIEGVDPTRAANFSKGKPWREIAALCVERGF